MQERPAEESSDFRQAVNLTFLLASAHAACLVPFIRHTYGRNYPGMAGALGLGLMFVTAGFADEPRMVLFMAAWCLMAVTQRVWLAIQKRRGWQVHSYYDGCPLWASWIPFCKAESRARQIEPVLCLPLGALLAVWSPVIGTFVAFGALSLTVVLAFQTEIRKRRVTDMQDLMIEQRSLSERLRGVRRDF